MLFTQLPQYAPVSSWRSYHYPICPKELFQAATTYYISSLEKMQNITK